MLFALASQDVFAASVCGKTIAIEKAGACNFGGGSWPQTFAAAKSQILSKAKDPGVRKHLSSANFNDNAGGGGAALFVSGSTVNLRPQVVRGGTPSTYSITLIHELCHVAGHAPYKGSTFQSSFNFKCGGVSPYARCGGGSETYAEACTAYLLAPERLKRCTNYGAVKNFFDTMFSGPIRSCAGGAPQTSTASGGGNGGGGSGGAPDLSALGPAMMMANQNQQQPEEEPYESEEAGFEYVDIATYCADAENTETSECENYNASLAKQAEAKVLSEDEESKDEEGAEISQSSKEDTSVARVNGDSADDFAGRGQSDPIFDNNSPTKDLTQEELANQYWGRFFGKANYGSESTDSEYPPNHPIVRSDEVKTPTVSSDVVDNNTNTKRAMASQKPKKVSREYAGMSLNAVDGLTGPFGRSLFRKVNDRYQKVRTDWKQEDSIQGVASAH